MCGITLHLLHLILYKLNIYISTVTSGHEHGGQGTGTICDLPGPAYDAPFGTKY